jgi:hypothetical protein
MGRLMAVTSSHIAINLQAVTSLFSALRSDVDAGLVPDSMRACGAVGDRARFGDRSPGGHVKTGAVATTLTTAAYATNVGVHLKNARNLIAAVERILANYRSSDEVASTMATSAMMESNEFPDESTSATATALPAGFVGPIASPRLPPQPTYQVDDMRWLAFDVPRLWSVLKDEGAPQAWEQVMAYRKLGEVLEGHYRRLLAMRPNLAEAWPTGGSTSAQEFHTLFDDHAKAVWADAVCAQTTATGLEGVIKALTEARDQIKPMYESWQNVTTDYYPEWWDAAAAKLNDRAREVMTKMEAAVADHRTNIILPVAVAPLGVVDDKIFISQPAPTTANASGELGTKPLIANSLGKANNVGGPSSSYVMPAPIGWSTSNSIPPIPGVHPIGSPVLSGGTFPVGISPTTPPSVLPVSPGVLAEAPNGGLWVLPGPGVGSSGRLLAKSNPRAVSAGNLAPTPIRGAAGIAPANSLVGVPLGGSPGGGSATPGDRRGRMATEQWEVAKGVPSVIGEREDSDEPDAMQSDEEGAQVEFDQWFARLAMPWSEAER